MLPEILRENVRLLGDLLGENLREHEGSALYQKVEDIRSMSKSLNEESMPDYQALVTLLGQLEDKDILPIVRAFNQFLNLANIADMEYFSSIDAQSEDSLDRLLAKLVEERGESAALEVIGSIRVELVLTAHPTEVTRRTLIQKYENIADTLSDRTRSDLLRFESNKVHGRLRRLIEEVWSTDEIRSERPTAVDEAKWGFAVIENNLWEAVPDFIRHLDRLCRNRLSEPLPLDFQPYQFYSWMGGDRDGNPNVTHEVTEEVILLGRWMAADLYLGDINELGAALSMHKANESLRNTLDNKLSVTPYRDYLYQLRTRLEATLAWTRSRLQDRAAAPSDLVIQTREELVQPLLEVRDSLLECGYQSIANGPLTDTIRRIYAFGINLVPLDIRQDSERHVKVLNELTNYLDMGPYEEWDEERKQEFLLEQLSSKRPLMPQNWPVSDESREVLDTCKIIAQQPREALSHYVISMAEQPSDVLAVALLLRESGVRWNMPIVPLFETLDDLDRAPSVMNRLWQNHWYRDYLLLENQQHQTVMIGYSDSAKDAGKLAATWAQYKAQEQLVNIAEQHDVNLVLFHGRGGTVGRGGGPVEKAMASQPPGSVKGRIRVTEQGEMIRYKFGLPRVAFNSLATYMVATINATVNPAPAPKQAWRDLIESMAGESLKAYRKIVRGHEHFVPYFRSLTPEQELNKLALGSRPAKRKASGGVESLRAIPWVFAWMQVRLNLPAWLGTGQALEYAQKNDADTLADMVESWPFFASFLDLLEMVIGKADAEICGHYERRLVDEQYRDLGRELRADLLELEKIINQIKQQDDLLQSDPLLSQTLSVRKPYIDPLNYLQVELLQRERNTENISPELERALKVTMAGISAGMRNTG